MKIRINKKNLYKEIDGSNINYYSCSTLVATSTTLYITNIKYSLTITKHINYIKRLHLNLPIEELK